MKQPGNVLRLVLVTLLALSSTVQLHAQSDNRVPWTSSRVIGTPEQPLPYSLEPAFPGLYFRDSMHVRWVPELQRYVVCELGGKLWSFPDDNTLTVADLMVDFKESLKSFDPERVAGVDQFFSFVFDPDFATNRFLYVCLILKGKNGKPLEDGSRISRFRVSKASPPTVELDSELPIITWLAGGHNGCDMAFDNEGCLLISTGDATEPSPPDRLGTGQDVSDLLSSILRIDVRDATEKQPYRIPKDNPFQNMPGVRPEIWAFGFRNPWRISVDRPTGQLWLGDVGWEKWELVHRVVRGGNYGWSIREGNELLQPNAPQGPAPILPTRVVLSHADAASVTGGFVYRGRELSAIEGHYIFGDWITGRIWAVPLDDHSPHKEVASGQLRIIAFAPDRNGEPLVVNHLGNTNLFRMVPNRTYDVELAEMRSFPRVLSGTGLFSDVGKQIPAEGVRKFEINQPQWCDGATSRHWIGLPNDAKVTVYNEPQPVGSLAMFNSRLHYPAGAVLVKTMGFDLGSANERKIETQLLHFDGRLWRGYSYLWNQDQSDAQLVDADGCEVTLADRGDQRWRVHSRSECLQCHNPWPETTLAFTPEQLHRPALGDDSPWLKLVREGYVETRNRQKDRIDPARCVRVALASGGSAASTKLPGLQSEDSHKADNAKSSLRDVARAYLHANCAHCHQNGAGAAVDLSLKIADADAAMKALDVAPQKGSFGIESGKLIAPGHAERSALIYRMASSSVGRMPHIGSHEVDFGAVATVADWIDAMSATDVSRTNVRSSLSQLQQRGEQLLTDVASMTSKAQSSTEPDRLRSQLLESALRLAVDLARHRSENDTKSFQKETHAWIAALAASSDPLVASLFEAHLPPNKRLQRLGTHATYADVAELTGDAARGRTYFFDTTRSQCSKCHQVGEQGGKIGPALSDVGKRLSPLQLFESIADPSRVIDPKFQSLIVVTSDGKVVTGLLLERNDKLLRIVNVQGDTVVVDKNEIESETIDKKSLMPAGIAGEMTAQQMADLLAYLSSLK